MSSQQWGEADSIPPRVQNGLCGVSTVPNLQRRSLEAVQTSSASLTDSSIGNVTSAALTPADVKGLPESALRELKAMGLTPPTSNATNTTRHRDDHKVTRKLSSQEAGSQIVRWSA